MQARIKGSHSSPRLYLNTSTGSYVHRFPVFTKLALKEAWEKAVKELE
jgi:hypothetical protein